MGAAFLAAAMQRDYEGLEMLATPAMVHMDHPHEPAVLTRRNAIDLVRMIFSDDQNLIELVTEAHRLSPGGVLASRAPIAAGWLVSVAAEIVLLGVRYGPVDSIKVYEAGDVQKPADRLAELERFNLARAGGALPISRVSSSRRQR